MSSNKLKITIFVILIIILMFIIFYSIFGTSLSYLSVKEVKQGRKLKENLINSFTINNLDTIYDKNNNIYYYNVSDKYENNSYVLKLDLDNEFKYKITDQIFNIVDVNYNEPIDIIIYNDKYYYETKIQLTNLPLISITTQQVITTQDVKSTFKYINSEETNKVVTNNSMIHIRGASSLELPKKSYRIDMYNNKYTDGKNVQISNFYNGDSFILDANYRDKSKIRNVLSTRIWNDVSNDFTNVDMYNEYVELFINGEYQGLYVFTEPVNRKNLNLPKTSSYDTSAVVKMTGWSKINSSTVFKNIDERNYMDYEIKYPNQSDWYSNIWEKLFSSIRGYYDVEILNTDKLINNAFNLENYIDIVVFNAFTSNADNCLGYNNYLYFDSLSNEIYIQPWDMEFSYGYYLDETRLPQLEYDKITCLFYQNDAPETNKLLFDRYWELRRDIFTKEYIDRIIDEFKNDLSKGVIIRDSSVWGEYNWETEIEKVRTWLYKRLEFFDDYVESLENE